MDPYGRWRAGDREPAVEDGELARKPGQVPPHSLEAAAGCCLPAGGSPQDVACFASVLEQDIAALEAEAKRDVEAPCSAAEAAADTFGSCETGLLLRAVSDDLDSFGRRDQQDSPSSESEDDESEDAGADNAAARIRANAAMLQACGRTLQPGAWKGCCKSPWCDREDRHRGLCNHRATIPGPAACPEPSDDACSSEMQGEAFDAPCTTGGSPRKLRCGESSSGGHSHTCASHEREEREVDSALKSGPAAQQQPLQQQQKQQQQQQQGPEEASVPFSCLPQLPQPPRAAAARPLQQQSLEEDLFWSGGAAQLVCEEQLFELPVPPLYHPLVEDLDAAGIGGVLGAEGLCPMEVEVELGPPPAVVGAEQQLPAPAKEHPAQQLEAHTTPVVESSGQRLLASAPSSPSCASVAAALAEAAFAPRPTAQPLPPLAPRGGAAPAAAPVPASCLAAGMLPLEEVHPPARPAAAAAGGRAGRAAPASASALAASTGARAAAVPLVAASASKPRPAAAAAPAAAEDTRGAAAASKPPAASRPLAAPKALAAAAAPPPPAGEGDGTAKPAAPRAPRLKQKPRRSDDDAPASKAADTGSPAKSKKRPAGRVAINPTSGHSCTQCGAVSTPVWRAGPAGPKTLCNACGVRYMKVAKRK